MAIPFFDNNNNERTPEEEHQLKLMLDLYVSLQNVIRSRHAQHTASRNREFYDLLEYFATVANIIASYVRRVSQR